MIPANLYPSVYYNIIGFFSFLLFVVYNTKKHVHIKDCSSLFVLLLVFFIGLRPLDIIFVDMVAYNHIFDDISDSELIDIIKRKGDIAFDLYVFFLSKIGTSKLFFLVTAFLYVYPMWHTIKRRFIGYDWVAFLMCIGAFSFFSYGTNGIRNGVAASLFILAIAYIDKKSVYFFFLLLACLFHKSMIIPTVGSFVSLLFINTKHYLYGWLIAIVLSLTFGDYWTTFFSNFDIDDRVSYLTTAADPSSFSSVGFRWDFLLYSSVPIIVGWYFIFRKKIEYSWYNYILNIYIFTNAFWVLVIRANFSNRFAYLSWCLYPFVLLYPFLYGPIKKNRRFYISLVVLFHFLFTYIMYLR